MCGGHANSFIRLNAREQSLNFLFIIAQDRTLKNTTENVIANMKIKSRMFYKKKFFFYNTHSLMK